MTPGARTPEELDALLEDAFVLRDRPALAVLFGEGSVVVQADGREARGNAAACGALAQRWARGGMYLSRPRRVVQSRDTALVVNDDAVHVLRRDGDRLWRAAISLLDVVTTTRSEAA